MNSTVRENARRADGFVLRLRTLGLVLVWAVSAQAATIYVDQDATGPTHDGSSWCNAYLTMQDALVAASSGTTIRVADGTYTPDQGGGQTLGDRSATFQLQNGVTLQGGYAGCGAPDPDARDIATHTTILSANLTGDDTPNFGNRSENSYHVVIGSGTDATAVIDGFAITAGNANDESLPSCCGGSMDNYGGGMYNYAGSPTVTNCTFSGNSAAYGGGMANFHSSPMVTNCTFTGNSGGGMLNYDNSSPTVTNSTFSGNNAIDGGGMINYVYSSPTVTNCTFSGNRAIYAGGGMYNAFYSSPTLTNCTFSGNSAPSGAGGGGMINWDYSSPTVINCTFSENSAMDGGGMANYRGSPTVTNCTFRENSADYTGGGMVNRDYSSPTATDCTFRNNSAYSGGGMYNDASSPTVTDCTFSGNSAYAWGGGMGNSYGGMPTVTYCAFRGNRALHGIGGGMFNQYSSPTVTNCTFSGNSAISSGGGMGNFHGSPAVTNCMFSGNSANGGGGGGLYNDQGSPKLTNCTFSGNLAAKAGGGISATDNTTVINCVLWGNVPSQITSSVRNSVVNYSVVQGGWSGAGGIGVLNADPLFADADGPDDIPGTEDDDLRLTPGSPAIDAADTTALPPDVADLDGDADTAEHTPRDLAGGPRVVDDPATADTGIPDSGVVDMGAYEFQPDCNANGLADECDLDCRGGKGTCDVSGCGQSPDSDANGVPDECEDGACCDLITTVCTENLLEIACSGPHRGWTEGAACVDVVCNAVTGACCDHHPFGACTDGLTQAACDCPTCEWEKLGSCPELDCQHTTIPTVSEWGLAVLTILLLTAAKVLFPRRASSAVSARPSLS